jgi:hypothetical protein
MMVFFLHTGFEKKIIPIILQKINTFFGKKRGNTKEMRKFGHARL